MVMSRRCGGFYSGGSEENDIDEVVSAIVVVVIRIMYCFPVPIRDSRYYLVRHLSLGYC